MSGCSMKQGCKVAQDVNPWGGEKPREGKELGEANPGKFAQPPFGWGGEYPGLCS
jgi:hypothetical protein